MGHDNLFTRQLGKGVITLAFALICPHVSGDITLDGTMGPAGAVSGPDYEITADLGSQVGSNLFHSFGRFNVGTGESATFSGPAAIANVIGRVTGGSASSIDGLLRTDFPSGSHPNLYLLNPSGILFGPNARLNVQGSFHISTADYLRLGSDGRFDATYPENTVLSVAAPVAFGFLDDRVAPVTVNGGPNSALELSREGETLSVVGGNITIQGGTLGAPSRRVNLASVASRGEVKLTDDDLETDTFNRLGDIHMSQGALIYTSGQGGGAIFIRSGRFVTESSIVLARTLGVGDGRGIDIDAREDIELKNQTAIQAISLGTGRAGDVKLKTNRLTMKSGASVLSGTVGAGHGGSLLAEAQEILMDNENSDFLTNRGFPTNLFAATLGTGPSGDTIIKTESLTLKNGAQIGSSTFGPGKAGKLSVDAKDILLEGVFGGQAPSKLATDSQGRMSESGDAGDLAIKTEFLTLRDGAQVSTITLGSGRGGQLSVEAKDILVEGIAKDPDPVAGRPYHSNLITSAQPGASGSAGNLTVKTERLVLKSGGQVGATTFGTGRGGNLSVEAKDILVDGIGRDQFPSALLTTAAGNIPGSGNAGNIRIINDTLTLQHGGVIGSQTGGPGKGGDISIEATDIVLRDHSRIDASSFGRVTGEAGTIWIKARNNLRLIDGSQIAVATNQADAGDINLNVGTLLHLRDGSSITSSAAVKNNEGTGSGGNINIDPIFVVLDGGSRIVAQAKRGSGGNINIVADFLFLSPDSLIDASSEFGQSGTVTINSPDTNISAKIIPLPEHFLNASALLSERCAARTLGEMGSFRVRSRHVPELFAETWVRGSSG